MTPYWVNTVMDAVGYSGYSLEFKSKDSLQGKNHTLYVEVFFICKKTLIKHFFKNMALGTINSLEIL